MTIRELITTWGFDIDDSKLQKLDRDIRSVQTSAENVKLTVKGMTQGMMQAGQNMSLFLTAPIVLYARKALQAAAQVESLEKALTNMMGSAEAGRAEYKKLIEAAKAPGLGFSEAIQASVRLQSVGFNADRAREAIVQFSNAVATTGGRKDVLDRVLTQLVQMAASGKIITQDLRPILQQAPAVAGAMKKLFGTIDPKKLEDRGISSEKFIEIMVDELKKLPRVAGGIGNDMDNMADQALRANALIGKGIGRVLPLFIRFGNFVQGLAEKFDKLHPRQQNFIIGVGLAVAAIGPMLVAIAKLGSLSSVVLQVAASFFTLAGASGIMSAAMSFALLTGKILLAFGVLGVLFLILNDVYTFLNDGDSMIGRAIKNWDALTSSLRENAKWLGIILGTLGLLGFGAVALPVLAAGGTAAAALGAGAIGAPIATAAAVAGTGILASELVGGPFADLQAAILRLGIWFGEINPQPIMAGAPPSAFAGAGWQYDVPPGQIIVQSPQLIVNGQFANYEEFERMIKTSGTELWEETLREAAAGTPPQ